MTEILIKEETIKEQEKIEEESKKQFVEELLFGIYKEDEKTISLRADLLNIKLNIPRVIINSRIWKNHDREIIVDHKIHESVFYHIKNYTDHNAQNIII